MTMLEARMALIGLVWDLLNERGVETKDFPKEAQSFTPLSLQRFLRGYTRLHPNQLTDLIDILKPHEMI